MGRNHTALQAELAKYVALTRSSGGKASDELISELASYIARLEGASSVTPSHLSAAARLATGTKLGTPPETDADGGVAEVSAAAPGHAGQTPDGPVVVSAPVQHTAAELSEPLAFPPAPSVRLPANPVRLVAPAARRRAPVPLAWRGKWPVPVANKRRLVAAGAVLTLCVAGSGVWLAASRSASSPRAFAALPAAAPSPAAPEPTLPPAAAAAPAPAALAETPPPAATLPPVAAPTGSRPLAPSVAAAPPATAANEAPIHKRAPVHASAHPARDASEPRDAYAREPLPPREPMRSQPYPSESAPRPLHRYALAPEWHGLDSDNQGPRHPSERADPVFGRYVGATPYQQDSIGSYVMGPGGVRTFIPNP